DEQVDDMLVVLENQSAHDAVVNVIEPTADQRKALGRQVKHGRRGIELAVEPRLDRVLVRSRYIREMARQQTIGRVLKSAPAELPARQASRRQTTDLLPRPMTRLCPTNR